MFIGVQYVGDDGEAKGRTYTYYTEMDLEENELVEAPVGPFARPQRAIVVAVDLPEPSFDCKEITNYATAVKFEAEEIEIFKADDVVEDYGETDELVEEEDHE